MFPIYKNNKVQTLEILNDTYVRGGQESTALATCVFLYNWGLWFVWGQRDKDVFSVSSALYSLVWTWPLQAELKPAHMTGISD